MTKIREHDIPRKTSKLIINKRVILKPSCKTRHFYFKEYHARPYTLTLTTLPNNMSAGFPTSLHLRHPKSWTISRSALYGILSCHKSYIKNLIFTSTFPFQIHYMTSFNGDSRRRDWWARERVNPLGITNFETNMSSNVLLGGGVLRMWCWMTWASVTDKLAIFHWSPTTRLVIFLSASSRKGWPWI